MVLSSKIIKYVLYDFQHYLYHPDPTRIDIDIVLWSFQKMSGIWLIRSDDWFESLAPLFNIFGCSGRNFEPINKTEHVFYDFQQYFYRPDPIRSDIDMVLWIFQKSIGGWIIGSEYLFERLAPLFGVFGLSERNFELRNQKITSFIIFTKFFDASTLDVFLSFCPTIWSTNTSGIKQRYQNNSSYFGTFIYY